MKSSTPRGTTSRFTLLTRDQFRDRVLNRRTSYREGKAIPRCCVPDCAKEAVDAHHIIERALWKDPKEEGGYFMENGAALCEEHHILAERNIITPDALRRWCGIQSRCVPWGYDYPIDKWGDSVLSEHSAYPHTPYFSFSPLPHGRDEHDRHVADLGEFVDVPLVITLKMDGANVCLTRTGVTGRNGEHANNPIFHRLKAQHAEFAADIPGDIEVYAEWLDRCHTIHYTGDLALEHRLMVFAARYGYEWLSWDDTVALGLPTVPVVAFHRVSTADYKLTRDIAELGDDAIAKGHEGIVVRSRYSFFDRQFEKRVAKYTRHDFTPGARFHDNLYNHVIHA